MSQNDQHGSDGRYVVWEGDDSAPDESAPVWVSAEDLKILPRGYHILGTVADFRPQELGDYPTSGGTRAERQP